MARKSIISLVLTLVLTFGALVLSLEAHESKLPTLQLLDAQPEIRAYLTPKKRAPLTSRIDGEVIKITVREGDNVTAGQTLITYDCKALNAQLNRARVEFETAQNRYLVMKELLELNSVGSLEAKASYAEQQKAKADIDFFKARIRGCVIKAPFTGMVSRVDVKATQYVLEGNPLLEIIDNQLLEMEMVLPSNWLSWLRPGVKFSIKIDENGKSYPAQVIRIVADVDPVSQTFKAIGSITGLSPELVPGMSGAAFFNIQSKMGGSKLQDTVITARIDIASSNTFFP
ncbi:MAG: efflux RND transporter periplasmic adaptor subunit [Magnetococcales bacterium]|nr:efflux RND transporter periplasmic adaptor subunit [Magnetococcales bacterium]